MDVWTDFVVAKREQADQVVQSDDPGKDFGGLTGRNVNQMFLAVLYSTLRGAPYDPSFMRDSLLADRSPDGPWVFEVPADLVSLLAAQEPKPLADVADVWASAEVFKLNDVSTKDVREFLAALADLCRQTETKGESLLLWLCL